MKIVKEKETHTAKALAHLGYKNAIAAPHLVKVTISSGTGSGMKKIGRAHV